jgi:hypothetical protein
LQPSVLVSALGCTHAQGRARSLKIITGTTVPCGHCCCCCWRRPRGTGTLLSAAQPPRFVRPARPLLGPSDRGARWKHWKCTKADVHGFPNTGYTLSDWTQKKIACGAAAAGAGTVAAGACCSPVISSAEGGDELPSILASRNYWGQELLGPETTVY